MRLNEFENRSVNRRALLKKAKLESRELRHPQLSIAQSLHPVAKFGQVAFIYRLSDVERSRFNVQVDNPGIVAVVA